MARVKREASPQCLILDSGAVIAASRGDDRALAYLRRAVEVDADVRVPVAVVAETTRGSARDAGVHRVLNAVGRCEPTTESIGRLAGELLGRAGRNETVDALVVAEASAAGNAIVLTGDPRDLAALADGLPGVQIVSLNR